MVNETTQQTNRYIFEKRTRRGVTQAMTEPRFWEDGEGPDGTYGVSPDNAVELAALAMEKLGGSRRAAKDRPPEAPASGDDAKACAECGAECDAGAKFCSTCGAELTDDEPDDGADDDDAKAALAMLQRVAVTCPGADPSKVMADGLRNLAARDPGLASKVATLAKRSAGAATSNGASRAPTGWLPPLEQIRGTSLERVFEAEAKRLERARKGGGR